MPVTMKCFIFISLQLALAHVGFPDGAKLTQADSSIHHRPVRPHQELALQQHEQRQKGPVHSDNPDALSKIDVLGVLPSSKVKPAEKPNFQERRTFLTKQQLKPISSIDCLQEKQRHPEISCSDPVAANSDFSGPINMGHFPHFKDGICRSSGEFFCDPSGLLIGTEQLAVEKRLQLFRERTMVDCGAFNAKSDPHAEHWVDENNNIHYGRLGIEDHRPFNFAVVVADEWPSSEMDAKSMEYFGNMVMAKWGLNPIYNGVNNDNSVNQILSESEQWRNCPHAAVLFLLPRYHEAFLTSPSCEFICPSRGGPEVVAAALAGLDRGGVKEAILSGVDEVQKVLDNTIKLDILKNPTNMRWRGYKKVNRPSSWSILWTIRIVFVSIVVCGVAILGAFVYYIFLPQKAGTNRNFYAMQGQNGRRFIQESFQDG